MITAKSQCNYHYFSVTFQLPPDIENSSLFINYLPHCICMSCVFCALLGYLHVFFAFNVF